MDFFNALGIKPQSMTPQPVAPQPAQQQIVAPQPVAPQQPIALQQPMAPQPVAMPRYGRPSGEPDRQMYQGNGQQPFDQQGMYGQQNYGYPPIPVYDKGGDVVAKNPSTLEKLGSAVKGAVSTLRSLAPDENEEQSLKSKQEQVDQASKKPEVEKSTPATSTTTTQQVDKVGGQKYGSKPGEVRYNVNSNGEIGAPVYDEGGDVDVNDGKHQVAILQDGEKVLTPEEAEQYREEHRQEKGAPADFGGRVLPNPKGLKPILDTDSNKKVDELTSGAKMSTDNAPINTPEGSISIPTAIHPNGKEISNPGGAVLHDVDTLSLKPYGKVMEEKANSKAAEQLANNSTPAEATSGAAAPAVLAPKEEKPKVTYGHILADQWLQKNGMPSMDSLRTPKEFNQGSPEQGKVEDALAPQGGAQTTPQGGFKPIVAPNNAALAPAPSGKEAFQQKIATYDKAYQAAMDMAAKTNDPQYREQAARIKEAKLAYEKEHPWGSKESAHPGILGKLGHVAEEIGQRTPGLSPIVSTLPGSEVYRGVEAQGAREQAKEASTENAAENKKLESAGYKQVTGGAIDPKATNELKGVPQTAFYNEKTGDIIYKGALAPKQTAGEAKASFQKTLAKIGTAEAADPGQQMEAINTAHLSGVIDDQEYREAIGYLGSTSNAPATQAAGKTESKMQGKLYYYDTPTGRKAMTTAEAKTAGFTPEQGYEVSAGQAEKDREKDNTYHTIQKALTQYQKHIGEGKLTPDDITTMTTITEDAEKPDYISKLIAGGFDDLLGHPITGYSEKLMKGTLTKNQYQDMSPAARQLVADYYTTMMAHFANMKASQGTIPRNPVIIQTEMHTIPKPFLSAEESEPAFKNYLDQVGMRNSDNVSFEKPKSKEKATPAAPANAQDEVVVDGKVVGHTVAGPDGKKKYVPLQQ